MNIELRKANEKELMEVNMRKESVCSGFHYVKQTHKHERCKKCDLCYKYFMYKNNKSSAFTEVRYKYVESFRECDLWGQKVDVEKPIEKKQPEKKPKLKSIDVYKAGYKNVLKNYPKLLDYVTWNELYAICTMKLCIENMDTVVRNSDVFKREFKRQYNLFYQKYKLYISEVYARCFLGDHKIVEEEAKLLSTDLFKFRLVIENYLNKFRINHAYVLSFMVLCAEMIDETETLFRYNTKLLHKVDMRATIAPFMSPCDIIPLIGNVVSMIINYDKFDGVIDLRKDMNVRNGMKVLHNRLINKESINRIIKNIDNFSYNQKNNNYGIK